MTYWPQNKVYKVLQTADELNSSRINESNYYGTRPGVSYGA